MRASSSASSTVGSADGPHRGGVDVPAGSQVAALHRDDVVGGEVVARALVTGGRRADAFPVVTADQDGVAGRPVVRRPRQVAGSGRGGDHATYDLGGDVGQVDERDEDCVGVGPSPPVPRAARRPCPRPSRRPRRRGLPRARAARPHRPPRRARPSPAGTAVLESAIAAFSQGVPSSPTTSALGRPSGCRPRRPGAVRRRSPAQARRRTPPRRGRRARRCRGRSSRRR